MDFGVELLQPDTLRDEDCRARLAELAPDVLCVASYGEILDSEILELPRVAPLNVHGSLLPLHRGASPVQAAILAGDATTGVSVQRMVEALDAGDVLHHLETPIGEQETAGELFDRLARLGAQALVEALDLLEDGVGEFVAQDESQATVCHKIKKHRGRLKWKQSVEQLVRRFRAMTPWPGAFTTLEDGETLKIHGVRSGPIGAARAVGVVGPEVDEGRLVVGVGDGALELTSVQPPGKRAMPTADFLRGARWEAGTLLGRESDRC